MRFFAALLAIASASRLGAQTASSTLHELRVEAILTLPRVHGYGMTLLLDERVAQADLAPNEVQIGVGVVTPQWRQMSLAMEARQVRTLNGTIEHRYIPTFYGNAKLPAGFMLRDRVRVELRDIAGTWSHRFVDRTAIGHDVRIANRVVFPYGQIDASWDSRYRALSRRDLTAGVRVPLWSGANVEPFIARTSDDNRPTHLGFVAGTIVRVAL